MLKKIIQNFIGGLFATSGLGDPKDKKPAAGGVAAGGASGFAEILALVDGIQIKKKIMNILLIFIIKNYNLYQEIFYIN